MAAPSGHTYFDYHFGGISIGILSGNCDPLDIQMPEIKFCFYFYWMESNRHILRSHRFNNLKLKKVMSGRQ